MEQHSAAAALASECLGGEHHLRMFLADLAAAWKAGGKIVVECDAIPGSGQLLKRPLILQGMRRPW